MSAPTTGSSRGFALRVPDTWYGFDVWRATRTGDLARLIDARIADQPSLAAHRGVLLKALKQAAWDADRAGAIYAGGMLDAVDGGHLVATLTVFQTQGAPDPADNTVEAIASQVTAVAPAEGSPYWRLVELIELPAGRAVRVRGVESAAAGERGQDGVVMQTLVPVPDGQGVLNVVLTTPQLGLAEPYLDLFDAVTSTLAWSEQSG